MWRITGGLALATATCLAAGCETPREEQLDAEQPSTFQVTGPDGTNHWVVVKCSSNPECYERASTVCPAGWSVYDKDKSTAYVVSGRSASTTTATASTDLSGTTSGTAVTTGVFHGQILPIEHGEMLVKCGASEQNDQKLLDQLKAFCDDGNAKACAALDLATKKRGCCSWHQGVRKCENHRIICFDGNEGQGDTCGC